jgi:hypothetical protein
MDGQGEQIASVVPNFTAYKTAGRPWDEAQNAERGDRFATAGFAYDPQHFAVTDGERHIVDGREWPGFGVKLHRQVLDV